MPRRAVGRAVGLPFIGHQLAAGPGRDRAEADPQAAVGGGAAGLPVIGQAVGESVRLQPRGQLLVGRRDGRLGGPVAEGGQVPGREDGHDGQRHRPQPGPAPRPDRGRGDRYPGQHLLPQDPPGQHRAERQHRGHLPRAEQVQGLVADHVADRVGQHGHGEHRGHQLPGMEEPPQCQPQGTHHGQGTGQVQSHEHDLDHRGRAEVAEAEHVRAEQLEERLQRHPGPVLQLAQGQRRRHGRLPESAQGGDQARRDLPGYARHRGRTGQGELGGAGRAPVLAQPGHRPHHGHHDQRDDAGQQHHCVRRHGPQEQQPGQHRYRPARPGPVDEQPGHQQRDRGPGVVR